MLIDLKKYFSGEDISQAIDYTVDLSEVEIDGCKPFVTPVQVKGSIRSFASSAELNVEVRYAYSMPCNRCLTLTRKELCHNISHVIVNKLNDEEDFEDYIVIEGDELDLDELIYSDIILLTPTKFLCKEDCKGLCPHLRQKPERRRLRLCKAADRSPSGGSAAAATIIPDNQSFSLI